MERSRVIRYALWVLVVLSPIVSYVIIGLATGTSLDSLDAWNSSWNDEQRHYRTVIQMRAFGEPSGIPGYDEVAAPRPSYGPYCALTYAPYYIGSFISGYESHNFMYVLNASFGVLACVLIVLLLKPDVWQSLLVAVLVGSEFVIARFMCSGMTEASYVLYGALFICCVLVALRNSTKKGSKKAALAALIVMVLATGFWGGMRPYILAFMVVPWLLLIVCDFGLSKRWRIALGIAGVIASALALGYYMYASKYYATPYLTTTSFADGFFTILGNSLAGLVQNNIDGILYSCKKFVHLRWRGVLLFAFALGFIVLLVMCIRAYRRRNRTEGTLYLALLLAGLLIFEANLLLYSYEQMYRMMIVVDVVYFVAIIFGSDIPKIAGKVSVRSLVVALSCATCIGSLAINNAEFAYPQYAEGYDYAEEVAVREKLQEIMPKSDDQWDNTVAHPIENGNIHLYYSLPYYLNTNNLRVRFTKSSMEADSFKSKYVSIPIRDSLNTEMKKRYPIIFEGDNHVIYQVRDYK